MTSKEERKQDLLDLLKKRAISFGEFTLASGASSPYYIDAKLATLIPKGFELAGEVMADALENVSFDAVGGLESGAIAIACSVARVMPVTIFFVRKNKKQHGTERWIEGPLQKDQRVVIVEDVVTTGASVIKAIKRVQEFGAQVVKVLVLVDRLQGAKENITRECGSDFTYQAIYNISDLGVASDSPV